MTGCPSGPRISDGRHHASTGAVSSPHSSKQRKAGGTLPGGGTRSPDASSTSSAARPCAAKIDQTSCALGPKCQRAVDPPSCSRAIASRYWKRSEEHTSELQSLMRISYAVFCLKKKKTVENISEN